MPPCHTRLFTTNLSLGRALEVGAVHLAVIRESVEQLLVAASLKSGPFPDTNRTPAHRLRVCLAAAFIICCRHPHVRTLSTQHGS